MSDHNSDEDEHDPLRQGNTDDSEAETEIASQNQTPVKRPTRDGIGSIESRQEGEDSTIVAGNAESVGNADRKRKTIARATSEDDSTAEASSDWGRQGSLGSPTKKARLSPEADSQSDVEQQQRRREGPTRHSERVNRPGKRVEINSNEARSQSPTRPSHRRSASSHSSAAVISERERRSKRRFASHEDPANARPSSHQPADSLHMARARGVDRSGRTPLAQACAKYPEQVNDLLAQSTEDVDKPDYTGNTPFQIAALEGNDEIMQMLINHGAEIHFANYEGDTPLIDSVTNGHVSTVRMLLGLGVNPLHKNREGKWASDFLDSIESKDDRDEIEGLLNGAIENRTGPPAPTMTPGPANQATSQKKLDHITPSIARLREYAGKGELEGVAFCLQAGVLPDNASLVAASQGGHHEVLSLLLAFGGDADPDPGKVKTTPMLAAIGRGNVDVVKMLSGANNFDSDRLVDGKHYWQIAEQKKGPDYAKEIDALKEASFPKTSKPKDKPKRRPPRLADINEKEEEVGQKRGESKVKTPSSPSALGQDMSPPTSARRRRLLSGREMAEEERGKLAERERERDEERARKEAKDAEDRAILEAEEVAAAAAKLKAAEEDAAREAAKAKAAEEEAARLKAIEEEAARAKAAEEEAARAKAAAEEAAREAAKAAAEEKALEEERRRAYLSSMPRALTATLLAGREFPLVQRGGNPWTKTIQDYRTLNAVRRVEIDPGCPPDQADEPFIMNWQAAILLGHHQLDEGARAHAWVTKSMTMDHRRQMWNSGIGRQLYRDAEWPLIPPNHNPADYECTIPFNEEGRGPNAYAWNSLADSAKDLFLALPDTELFWVKLEDFNATVRNVDNHRLQDLSITADFSAHVDREALPDGKFGPRRSNVNLPRMSFTNGVRQESSKSANFSWATMASSY